MKSFCVLELVGLIMHDQITHFALSNTAFWAPTAVHGTFQPVARLHFPVRSELVPTLVAKTCIVSHWEKLGFGRQFIQFWGSWRVELRSCKGRILPICLSHPSVSFRSKDGHCSRAQQSCNSGMNHYDSLWFIMIYNLYAKAIHSCCQVTAFSKLHATLLWRLPCIVLLKERAARGFVDVNQCQGSKAWNEDSKRPALQVHKHCLHCLQISVA